MGNTLWFITLLKEQPWVGFLIGLAFLLILFLIKILVVHLYSKPRGK